ncbi:uncharacterized protein LOC119664528 [Teleopsis dalmanni]|uniref:uncharacterized protein LOC119664528 n=1 Tax=Teleopsis dalmanni TaxID=139649 RepID=UPI0018CF9951|nr:uncharacterized protein LOC119664528 [Teleopsis dalmanni]
MHAKDLDKVSDSESPTEIETRSKDRDTASKGNKELPGSSMNEELGRQFAGMMRQQQDFFTDCIQSLRAEVGALNNRMKEVEGKPLSTSPQHATNVSVDFDKPFKRNVDLERWHIKFDGSNRDMTVESFLFRVERMREQYGVSYQQLFTEFHCLLSGDALKWFWQLLEHQEGNRYFDYFQLKPELLAQFKSAESDYDIIRRIMERKQQPNEDFKRFYKDIHDLTFRLKRKIPEPDLAAIIKNNIRAGLASLLFSATFSSLTDLRRECNRAEKLLRENKRRNQHISEVCQKEIEYRDQKNNPRWGVEVIGLEHREKGMDMSKVRTDPEPERLTRYRSGVEKDGNNDVGKSRQDRGALCPSPFHLNLCYSCGMPVDFYTVRQGSDQKTMCTIVTLDGDNRIYVKTKVNQEEVMALLDSGAMANCIGKEALEFLRKQPSKLVKLTGKAIKTASGGEVPVIGVVSLPVLWEGQTEIMDFLVVPTLQQPFYFGIDFWKTFEIPLITKRIRKAETLGNIGELTPCSADLKLTKQHPLNTSQQKKLEQVIKEFPSFSELGLGSTNVESHKIEVTNEQLPVKQRHYPISPAIQKLMYDELDRMLSLGVIKESNSSWSSPVTLVVKENKHRLCLDARKVNDRTIKDAYPLPHIEGILSRLQDTKYISAIDLKDAFWQIPLERESREKTAFTVPGRPLYQFTVMPFGLCNAAQRMCRLMDKVIPAALRERVFVYLDDLLVCSSDFETHMILLKKVADCLSKANLTINVQKSKFCHIEVKYLGYIVGNGIIKTDPAKVEAMNMFPEPRTAKQLRRFLGMTGWYRRFIQDYATIAASLHDCLSKGNLKKFTLTDQAKVAFDKLKTSLITAPVLTNPDFNQHFYIQCDASADGIGDVLFQIDQAGNERPIAYMSSKLNKAQKNYSVTEQECLAAVLSVKKFRAYIEGLPFTIITDHASLK